MVGNFFLKRMYYKESWFFWTISNQGGWQAHCLPSERGVLSMSVRVWSRWEIVFLISGEEDPWAFSTVILNRHGWVCTVHERTE